MYVHVDKQLLTEEKKSKTNKQKKKKKNKKKTAPFAEGAPFDTTHFHVASDVCHICDIF